MAAHTSSETSCSAMVRVVVAVAMAREHPYHTQCCEPPTNIVSWPSCYASPSSQVIHHFRAADVPQSSGMISAAWLTSSYGGG
jgi:hypothetical protein